MTKFFAEAVAAVSQLPEPQQDEIARLMLQMIEADRNVEEIDPAHLEGVMIGIQEIRNGQRATDAEVEAAFRRFGS
jgi:hypothetical protein